MSPLGSLWTLAFARFHGATEVPVARLLKLSGPTLIFLGTFGGLGVGLIFLQLVPTYKPPPETVRSGNKSQEIKELLRGLPEKSRREKIEAAYDAAIKTDEIGFPQSKK